MKPFDHNKFIGYICEVTPQYVRMQIPSARLLHSFYFDGEIDWNIAFFDIGFRLNLVNTRGKQR